MIKIIQGYGFTYDRYGYSLFEIGEHEAVDKRTREKTGETKEHAYPVGHYANVRDMANGLLNFAAKKDAARAGCETLADFVMIMENIKNEIVSALKGTAI